MMVRAELRIRGRVQGVFYRQSTQQTAAGLGLTGWVKNLPDGSVQAVVEGPADRIRELVDWCRKGPPAAYVESLEVDWLDATEKYAGFEVR